MKKKMLERVLAFVLSVTLLLSAVGLTTSAASLKEDTTGTERYPYQPSTLEEMKTLVGTPSYKEYIANYATLGGNVTEPIFVDIIGGLITDGIQTVADSQLCKDSMVSYPEKWENFDADANKDDSIYIPANGSVSWQVVIPEGKEGLYNIKFVYYSVYTSESSDSSIERLFRIDGKIPFKEVATLSISKDWVYKNVSTETFEAVGEADSYDVEYKFVSASEVENLENAGYFKIVTSVSGGVKTVTTYKIKSDILDNSMSSESTSLSDWNTFYLQDMSGFNEGYYQFYMADGTRTITLTAEREPMILKAIVFEPVTAKTASKSYAEVLAEYAERGYTAPDNGGRIEIQAEFPDMVSNTSVAPTNDNTSPLTSYIQANSQVYNVIGETGYSTPGYWAAYTFRVTKDGLYNLAMRYKQSALEGMFVCRAVKLSGGSDDYRYGLEDGTPTVPFEEANSAEFNYSKDWQSTFVGPANGSPFLFYFEAGYDYTVYFECSLGTLGEYIKKAQESLDKVNDCYLRILQLTGTEPDEYRSYDFLGTMPDVLKTLQTEAGNLIDIMNDLKSICGTGTHLTTLETVARLFQTMGNDAGANIAVNMATFKTYLGTLGTWINSSKSGTIMVDSIWVIPSTLNSEGEAVADESQLPKAKAGFFQSIWFEIKSFFSSFFVDYDSMGLTVIPDENTATIDVWLAYGRDQSQIWRTMIDSSGGYTDSTGNAVALKLVTAGTLLPSILSGKGPDVYMGLTSAEVINYAVRDAVLGINGLDTKHLDASENATFTTYMYTYKTATGSYITLDEPASAERIAEEGLTLTFESKPFDKAIEGQFAPAAMDTITLLGQSYGIPLTMTFAMMFYRMDVLAQLEQEVPESWDELLSVLPLLQSNNMSIGVAYINALDFMIYQMGGNMWKYTDTSKYDNAYAGMEIDLDNPIALQAFEFTCRLYSDFSFPVSYDAANRFRTGEMPILIGDYISLYNQLVIFATDIGGLWEFCSLPGSKRADGTFNYDSLAGVSADILLRGCDNLLASWQFLQWQTAPEAQAEYGNRIVTLIGPAAKYETANLNAINNLSWTTSEKMAIMNQMDHMSSIVNYPGSYYITRYIQFAFLDAVNNGANPTEALTSYIDAINSEIERKRAEFGLITRDDLGGEDPPEIGA